MTGLENKERKSLTLVELLDLVNKGYPDNFMSEYYNPKTGKLNRKGSGDLLAKFIVIELIETFDPDSSFDEQIEVARQVLDNTAREIDDVVYELGRA